MWSYVNNYQSQFFERQSRVDFPFLTLLWNFLSLVLPTTSQSLHWKSVSSKSYTANKITVMRQLLDLFRRCNVEEILRYQNIFLFYNFVSIPNWKLRKVSILSFFFLPNIQSDSQHISKIAPFCMVYDLFSVKGKITS